MTTFGLKLIALIAMLIDHIASAFGTEGWNLLPINVTMLRYIGRISYPIFAFCIVNGWGHTRNKENYFQNLCVCAIISQIPFSLALNMQNTMAITSGSKAFYFSLNPIYFVFAFVLVLTYWYFAMQKKWSGSIVVVAIVFLLPAILLKVNHIWILADNLNVLYTLLSGASVLFLIEQIREKTMRWWEYVWLTAIVILLSIAYSLSADYGYAFMGIVLIVLLYVTRTYTWAQSIAVALWGIIYYGIVIHNLGNAIATFIPAFLILSYNKKKGLNNHFAKRLFYITYPAHLLLIGLLNIYINLR